MPVLIASKKEGFRRCGVAHAKEPVEYADGRWSAEQLKALKAEPMLVVTEVDGEKGDDKPNAKETIAMVKAAATIEALDALAAGEERKSVLEAIEARRKELSA